MELGRFLIASTALSRNLSWTCGVTTCNNWIECIPHQHRLPLWPLGLGIWILLQILALALVVNECCGSLEHDAAYISRILWKRKVSSLRKISKFYHNPRILRWTVHICNKQNCCGRTTLIRFGLKGMPICQLNSKLFQCIDKCFFSDPDAFDCAFALWIGSLAKNM